MNEKNITALFAAMFGLAAFAETPSTLAWSYESGTGISFNETPIVTAEFGMSLDSRYILNDIIYAHRGRFSEARHFLP